MTIKKFLKITFLIIAILAIGYTVMSLFSVYYFADVKCQTKPLIINSSDSKKYEAIITNKTCDDGRPILNKVYIRYLASNKKELIYEVYSEEKLDLYAVWKPGDKLHLLIPVYQDKYGEIKYDVSVEVIYIPLNESFE